MRFLLPRLLTSCFDKCAAGAAELSRDIAECFAGVGGILGWIRLEAIASQISHSQSQTNIFPVWMPRETIIIPLPIINKRL